MLKNGFGEKLVETDVLCIGGGIAGLMAAIRASELGARVVVAEKANVLHSGSGAVGNDHFMCYIPEMHGPDIAVFLFYHVKQSKGKRTLPFGT
jgi:succinate dehydrogenase/fumarate reductase flavoprotein subunit